MGKICMVANQYSMVGKRRWKATQFTVSVRTDALFIKKGNVCAFDILVSDALTEQ
jgi:hypothetical protein